MIIRVRVRAESRSVTVLNEPGAAGARAGHGTVTQAASRRGLRRLRLAARAIIIRARPESQSHCRACLGSEPLTRADSDSESARAAGAGHRDHDGPGPALSGRHGDRDHHGRGMTRIRVMIQHGKFNLVGGPGSRLSRLAGGP